MRTLIVFVLAVAVFAAIPAPAQDYASLDAALDAASRYTFGQDRYALAAVESFVQQSLASEATKREAAAKLALVLNGGATDDCKRFLCRLLVLVGNEDQVLTLSRLMRNEELADIARYALEMIPGDKAEKALLSALRSTRGSIRIGVIGSLGARGVDAAVPQLAQLARNKDEATARAALTALGQIGSDDAAKALARLNVPAPLGADREDALIRAGQALAARGNTDESLQIFRGLWSESVREPIRLGALAGLLRIEGMNEADLMRQILASDQLATQEIVGEALRTLPDAYQLTGDWDKLNPRAQALVIDALAGNPAADNQATVLKLASESASSDNVYLRLAAIRALSGATHPSAVGALQKALEAAPEDDRETARLVRLALQRVHGDGVDEAVVSLMTESAEAGNMTVAPTMIQAAADRRIAEAVPVLMVTATEADNSDLRIAALQALAPLTGQEDLPALVEILIASVGTPAEAAAKDTVVRVARSDDTAQPVIEAYGDLKRKQVAEKAALLETMGRIEDAGALPVLRKASKSRKSEISDAAVRALAGWPTTAVIEDLIRIANKPKEPAHRTVAFRGYLRVLRLPSDGTVEELLDGYRVAIGLSQTPDDLKQVLAGLAEAGDEKALVLVEPYLDDPDVKAEAELAAKKLKGEA